MNSVTPNNFYTATSSYLLITPTPQPPTPTLDVGPPSGWVAAGLLGLLLVIMLYQSLKKLLVGLFRRKKRK